jgi:hypothetical protein
MLWEHEKYIGYDDNKNIMNMDDIKIKKNSKKIF